MTKTIEFKGYWANLIAWIFVPKATRRALNQAIQDHTAKQVKAAQDEIESKLRNEFQEKIEFMNQEALMRDIKGIAVNEKLDVITFPVRGMDLIRDAPELRGMQFEPTHLFGERLEQMTSPESFASLNITSNYLRGIAARELAEKLVEAGLLQAEFRGRMINFYVNVFGVKS